jgi:hypothetical protein
MNDLTEKVNEMMERDKLKLNVGFSTLGIIMQKKETL